MSGQGWEVFVWEGPSAADGYGQLLCQVPGWSTLSIAPLASDPGSGSIQVPLTSPIFYAGHSTPETSTVLAKETLWQVKQDGTTVVEFLAETINRNTVDASEQPTVTVSGPGTGKVLNWGMAMPTGWDPSRKFVIKTSAIQDGFSTSDGHGGFQVDAELFNLCTPGRVTIPQSGTVQVAIQPPGAFLGGGPYDISGSSFSAQVTPSSLQDGSEVTQLIVKAASGQGYAMIALSAKDFYAAFANSAGTVTTHVIAKGQEAAQPTTPNASVYDSSWAQYWRISCDLAAGGAQVWKFWTSGDGSAWALKWTVSSPASPFSASAVNVFVGGQYDVGSSVVDVGSVNGEVQAPPLAGPVFSAQPIMATYLSLLAACQARGTIGYVTPTFTAGHDSAGVNWTDSWSVQVPAGTDLLSLAANYVGAMDGDWVMKPGYSLWAGSQGSLGTDRHLTLTFHEGEVTQLGRTQTRDQVRNVVASPDGLGIIHSQVSSDSITKWGQREGWAASGGTTDPQSAVNVAAAALQQFADEVSARILQIPPNAPGKTVFKDFGLLDWIGIERSDFSATDSLRVLGISVTIDEDGAETHEVVLQTYRQYLVQFYAYLINKLGGSLASALGSLVAGASGGGIPTGALGVSALVSGTQPTGSGASSAGLITATSLAATPEVAGNVPIIPGTMITDSTLPQSALSFQLPSGAEVSFLPNAPASPNTGDLWYQTDATGTVTGTFQWNGSVWAPYLIGPSAVAFTAQSIGGVQHFIGPAAPPAGSFNAGSIWLDTSSIVNGETGAGAVLNVTPDGVTWVPQQWGTGSIATGSVTAAQIAAETITSEQIQAGAITAQSIAAGSITTLLLSAGSVDATIIAAGAVVAGTVAAGAIDGLVLNGNVLNAAQVYGDVVVLSGANDGVFCYGQPPTTVKIFQVGGTTTAWVDPAGVTTANVYVTGGAAGGGNSTGGGAQGGGGGGGGGCAVSAGYALTPGNTYFAHVGGGGTGGNSGAASWFNTSNVQGGVVGNGGSPGGNFGTAGAGGTASGGTSAFNGGNGGTDTAQAGGGGGGGGGAGGGGNGSAGKGTGSANGGGGGTGGASSTDGGTGGGTGGSGGGTTTGARGANGGFPGGGGGGGGTGGNGGIGGNGRVLLVYTASSQTLVASITGLAGVDPVNGAAVPQGLYGNALELSPQAAVPTPANSSDAVLYSNNNGTPSGRTPANWNGGIPLSKLDHASFTVTAVTQTQFSKAWSIPGNDAELDSLYRLAIWGTCDSGSAQRDFTIYGYLSGSLITSTGIAAAWFQTATTYILYVEFDLLIESVGVSGTVRPQIGGRVTKHGALLNNQVSTAGAMSLGDSSAPSVVDTTGSNTMEIQVAWGGTGATATCTHSMLTRMGA